MIKSALIHPQLLGALAACGHKSQLLIADANYAVTTNARKDATVVYLNLSPGMIPAPLVLEKVLTCINVEHAALMTTPADYPHAPADEYRRLLPDGCPVAYLEREQFYAEVKSERTALIIATGEQRRFANLLLTVAPVF
ncbi:RbsD/FucU family protein [Serratia rubidaea]|uniref:RbsD/FucU family protein n=1 Tax=Serratia rubidaea TaxID=61652 RepID=UPI001BAFAAD2|nr:RbsD/FucU family protein [Serratia rubidaea]MBS0973020.1 RbsD/FucU family protein [Serratia rubidaea]MDC6110938.1 RbsD/FucU family protein [Serratia rubidaea]